MAQNDLNDLRACQSSPKSAASEMICVLLHRCSSLFVGKNMEQCCPKTAVLKNLPLFAYCQILAIIIFTFAFSRKQVRCRDLTDY